MLKSIIGILFFLNFAFTCNKGEFKDENNSCQLCSSIIEDCLICEDITG